MHKTSVWLAALTVYGPVHAYASWTGDRVVEYCKTNDPRLEGYIAGWREKHLTDSLSMLFIKRAEMASDYGSDLRDSAYKNVTAGVCPPHAMTNEKIREAVCTYALAFPGGDNKDAQTYVIKALREIAPCKG